MKYGAFGVQGHRRDLPPSPIDSSRNADHFSQLMSQNGPTNLQHKQNIKRKRITKNRKRITKQRKTQLQLRSKTIPEYKYTKSVNGKVPRGSLTC
eukprot:4831704-Heterocapsa_arctica.AAC.1